MAAETTSRSPSPVPAPPLASAPGPRAQRLQTAFGGALTATLKKVSYENFSSCFPTPAKYRPETLDAFWRDFTGRLDEVCAKEFEGILRERDVVRGLNELDLLCAEAEARRKAAEAGGVGKDGGEAETPVPPHTLPPGPLLQAHLLPFLASHEAALSETLKTTQEANGQLLEDIKAQREEMALLVGGLEELVRDLENAAGLMGREEVQGLTGEVKEVDVEMKGA